MIYINKICRINYIVKQFKMRFTNDNSHDNDMVQTYCSLKPKMVTIGLVIFEKLKMSKYFTHNARRAPHDDGQRQ